MSSRRRSSRISRQIETAPNVRQVKFTPRDRLVKAGRPSAERNLVKQDTLTQLGWAPSPGIQEKTLFEDDDLKPMSEHNTKRRNFKQNSTLTQMNYLIRAWGNDVDDLLQYEAENKENIEVGVPPAKRRKGLSGKTTGRDEVGNNMDKSTSDCKSAKRISQRRSNGKSTREQHGLLPSDEIKDSQSECSSQEEQAKFYQANKSEAAHPATSATISQTLMPPPPETPQKRNMREIPSSQSPATTPFSVHRSQSYRKSQSRSPLQERSSNAIIPLPSNLARKQPTPKIVIADSVESENTTSSSFLHKVPSQDTTLSSPHAKTMMQSSRTTVDEPPSERSNRVANALLEKPIIHQIEDSDEDLDENDWSPFAKQKLTCTTPHALQHQSQTPQILSSSPSPIRHASLAPSSGKPIRSQNLIANISTMPTRAVSTLQVPSSPPLFTQPRTQFNEPFLPLSSPTQILAHNGRSYSQEATTQLLSDLARHTKWNPASCIASPSAPNHYQGEDTQRTSSILPSGVMNGDLDLERPVETNVDVPSSQPPLLPQTEKVHVPSSQPPPFLRPPFPPSSVSHATPYPSTYRPPPSASQATTADVTQTQSPRSSAPRLADLSSPLTTRRDTRRRVEEPNDTWHWDGDNRLTDSQLLPQSLLMDSLRGPPTEWEELEEEEH